MITTSFTYIRRSVRGDNVYLYEVTIYRDKETGKVKQRLDYTGKEIMKIQQQYRHTENIQVGECSCEGIRAFKAMHAAPVCEIGDRNKGKDVPLHPWLLNTGDDRIPIWIYLLVG